MSPRKPKPRKVRHVTEGDRIAGTPGSVLVHDFDREKMLAVKATRKPKRDEVQAPPIGEAPEPLDADVIPGVLGEMAVYWPPDKQHEGSDGIVRLTPMSAEEFSRIDEQAYAELMPLCDLYCAGFLGAVPSDPEFRAVFDEHHTRSWTHEMMAVCTTYIIETHQLPEES